MDFIVRVQIDVNGLAEEQDDVTPQEAMRAADSYITYPKWVDPKQVERARNLKCFETVREMLLSGIPAVEVARQIHLLGEMKDWQVDSIRVMVEHLKATLPKAQMLARMVPTAYASVKKKVDAEFDCMKSLVEIQDLMKKRLQIAYRREEAVGFLLKDTAPNFAIMLDIVSKIHDIQKDLIGPKGDIEMDVQKSGSAAAGIDWSRVYSSPKVNEVMANPESRARLLRFTETLSNVFGRLSAEQQERIMEKAADKVRQEQAAVVVVEDTARP